MFPEASKSSLINKIANLSFCSVLTIVASSLIGLSLIISTIFITRNIQFQQNSQISAASKIVHTARSSLDRALSDIKGSACSEEFVSGLRSISFLPDGLNEFLYAPNQSVECGSTVGKFVKAVDLGKPDARDIQSGMSFWFNQDLLKLGRPGSEGTIVERERYAVVIPYFPLNNDFPSWVQVQLFATDNSGNIYNLAGSEKLVTAKSTTSRKDRWGTDLFQSVHCPSGQIFCVAVLFDPANYLLQHTSSAFIALTLLAALAWIVSTHIYGVLQKYKSFEARFLRDLSSENIVPFYQPILDIRSGRISGCEVLARYRDIDGSIVTPDKFIDVVVRAGLTLEFTRMIVEKAHQELCEAIPLDQKLQVNLNVFPRDANSSDILSVFETFSDSSDPRFTVAAELVETESLDFPELKAALPKFKAAGIKVYIDDFGTGYSSLENLFALPFDGTKLDRSFALAPTDSLLGQMFCQILDLLKASERPIVVEGIETMEKLEVLRQSGAAQYVQGYVISRPVGIEDFATFLSKEFSFEETKAVEKDAA